MAETAVAEDGIGGDVGDAGSDVGGGAVAVESDGVGGPPTVADRRARPRRRRVPAPPPTHGQCSALLVGRPDDGEVVPQSLVDQFEGGRGMSVV
eukprot:7442957-Pyramimonas_sp.AAC.1